jgi:MIP family channel proteins
MVFGIAVVAQVVLSDQQNGAYLSINIGWGLAVVMGVYASAGISGGHINPAVTLALAVHRRFAWSKVPFYIAAQMAGAFAASVVVYVTYYDALQHFDGGLRQVVGEKGTAGIWATYPQEFLSNVPGALLDQVVGTALLVTMVFALSDRRNLAPQSNLGPFVVGMVVLLIGMTFGYNCGYAINPARDLMPRLFTAMAGWGSEVFRAGNGFWWVPIVGPCVGGVLGGFIYDLLITRNYPPEEPVD